MDRQEVYTTTIDQWIYLTTLGRGRARNFQFQAPVAAVDTTDDAVSMAPPVAPLIHSTYSNQTSETFPPIVPYARKQEPEAPSLALVLKNLALALEMKDLPNEMLSAILKELPPNLLMHCRLVNSRFRDCIHALYKSCAWLLLFTSKDHNARDLARRHFAGNLQPFVGFKMKPLLWDGDSDGRRYITTITYKFLEILLGMFPLLEHFLIDVGLDYESANALIHFLPDMRMLTTLSIFKTHALTDKIKEALVHAINRCESITRLGISDLGRHWPGRLLVHRLEHFAYEAPPNKDNFNPIIKHLTTKCLSLFFLAYPLTNKMIQEWRILNAAFVGNLRKLSIGNILSENAELGFVNVSFFTSLVILRIQFETNGISDFDAWYPALDPVIFNTMTGLHRLKQLELTGLELNMALFQVANLKPLWQVTTLSLYDLSADNTFDGAAFGQIFSFLFPCLLRLNVSSQTEAVHQQIAAHRNMFTRLVDFNFELLPPPPPVHIPYFCVG